MTFSDECVHDCGDVGTDDDGSDDGFGVDGGDAGGKLDVVSWGPVAVLSLALQVGDKDLRVAGAPAGDKTEDVFDGEVGGILDIEAGDVAAIMLLCESVL